MITLSSLLENIAYIFIFYYLLGCPFVKNHARITFACLTGICWLILQNCISLPFPNTFIVLIIIMLLFDCKPGFKLAWVIICSTIGLFCIYFFYDFTYLITHYCLKNKYLQNINIEFFDFLFFILVFIFCPLFQKKRRNRSNILQSIRPTLYCLISVVCICIFFLINAFELIWMGDVSKTVFSLFTFSSLMLIFLAIIALILIFKIQYKNSQLKQLSQVNQEMLTLEKKQYQLLQDKNNTLRSFRHDFNGHILALQTYIKQNELDKLFAYINNLAILQTEFKIYFTNNIIVDAIINQIGESLDSNIVFKVSGQFNKECFINDFDLCILFTNLLSNSVESLNRLSSTGRKEIYVEIESTINEIQFKIMNTSKSYSDTELHNLTTSKTDSANHGFGLKNIECIVKKYHGDLFFDYKNSFFITYISCKNIL